MNSQSTPESTPQITVTYKGEKAKSKNFNTLSMNRLVKNLGGKNSNIIAIEFHHACFKKDDVQKIDWISPLLDALERNSSVQEIKFNKCNFSTSALEVLITRKEKHEKPNLNQIYASAAKSCLNDFKDSLKDRKFQEAVTSLKFAYDIYLSQINTHLRPESLNERIKTIDEMLKNIQSVESKEFRMAILEIAFDIAIANHTQLNIDIYDDLFKYTKKLGNLYFSTENWPKLITLINFLQEEITPQKKYPDTLQREIKKLISGWFNNLFKQASRHYKKGDWNKTIEYYLVLLNVELQVPENKRSDLNWKRLLYYSCRLASANNLIFDRDNITARHAINAKKYFLNISKPRPIDIKNNVAATEILYAGIKEFQKVNYSRFSYFSNNFFNKSEQTEHTVQASARRMSPGQYD